MLLKSFSLKVVWIVGVALSVAPLGQAKAEESAPSEVAKAIS